MTEIILTTSPNDASGFSIFTRARFALEYNSTEVSHPLGKLGSRRDRFRFALVVTTIEFVLRFVVGV